MTHDDIADVIFFNVSKETNAPKAMKWLRCFIKMNLEIAYDRGRADEKREAVPGPEKEQ